MTFKQTYLYQTQVDFDLLDAGNVVYHPNYLILCERARNAALAAAGYPFQEMWSNGYALAVVDCHSKYFKAIELGQDLIISSRTTGATGSKLMVHQEIILACTVSAEDRVSGFRATPAVFPSQNVLFQADYVLASVRLNPLKGTPRSLVIGHATDGPLFVVGPNKFLDGKTFKVVELEGKEAERGQAEEGRQSCPADRSSQSGARW